MVAYKNYVQNLLNMMLSSCCSLLLGKWSISYILCKFYGGWFFLKYFLIYTLGLSVMTSSGSLWPVIDALCSSTDISDCGFFFQMSSPSTNAITLVINKVTDTHTNAMMTSILG